jgi:hypothetical protein
MARWRQSCHSVGGENDAIRPTRSKKHLDDTGPQHTSDNIITGNTSEPLSIMDRDTVEVCRLVLGRRYGQV